VNDILLKSEEAAELLKIGERTLWQLTKEGKIPYVRVGKCLRYRPEALREWARSQETPATVTAPQAAAG
jgi:excisionase family DNA binding protein